MAELHIEHSFFESYQETFLTFSSQRSIYISYQARAFLWMRRLTCHRRAKFVERFSIIVLHQKK